MLKILISIITSTNNRTDATIVTQARYITAPDIHNSMDSVINTWRTDDFDLRLVDDENHTIVSNSNTTINSGHTKKIRNSIHSIHKLKLSVGTTTITTITTNIP